MISAWEMATASTMLSQQIITSVPICYQIQHRYQFTSLTNIGITPRDQRLFTITVFVSTARFQNVTISGLAWFVVFVTCRLLHSSAAAYRDTSTFFARFDSFDWEGVDLNTFGTKHINPGTEISIWRPYFSSWIKDFVIKNVQISYFSFKTFIVLY